MVSSVEGISKGRSDIVADNVSDLRIAPDGLLNRLVPFRFCRFYHRIDFGIVEPAAVHIVPPQPRAFYHHVRKISLQSFDGIFKGVRFSPFA